jgi:hypothetical protein
MPRAVLYAFTLFSVAGAVVFTLWGEVLKGWMIGYWLVVLGCWAAVFRGEVLEVVGFIRAGAKL